MLARSLLVAARRRRPSVRFNGRVYEAVIAAWQRRSRRDLYHSALEAITAEGRYVLEMAPELIRRVNNVVDIHERSASMEAEPRR